HSSSNPRPATAWMAPSTPPPPSSVEFAALTMASAATAVMSPCMMVIFMIAALPRVRTCPRSPSGLHAFAGERPDPAGPRPHAADWRPGPIDQRPGRDRLDLAGQFVGVVRGGLQLEGGVADAELVGEPLLQVAQDVATVVEGEAAVDDDVRGEHRIIAVDGPDVQVVDVLDARA